MVCASPDAELDGCETRALFSTILAFGRVIVLNCNIEYAEVGKRVIMHKTSIGSRDIIFHLGLSVNDGNTIRKLKQCKSV
jgi:hypothetical protein